MALLPLVSQTCSPGKRSLCWAWHPGFSVHLSPSRRQTTSAPQGCTGERGGRGHPGWSARAPPEKDSGASGATSFPSYLGTPTLEPMPEDCKECRRFLAVASGWASASCWMAACRARREAASLGEGQRPRWTRGLRAGVGGGLRPSPVFPGKQHCTVFQRITDEAIWK